MTGTSGTGAPDRAGVAVEMRRAVDAIQRWSQRTMHRETGTPLSLNETHLLSHLHAAPPQRMSALARWQGVDRSTMTMQIGSLVERGLVRRTPDPADRRATNIEPTAEGRAALEDYTTKASNILSAALEGWDDAELERFGAYLTRFADDLDATLREGARGGRHGG